MSGRWEGWSGDTATATVAALWSTRGRCAVVAAVWSKRSRCAVCTSCTSCLPCPQANRPPCPLHQAHRARPASTSVMPNQSKTISASQAGAAPCICCATLGYWQFDSGPVQQPHMACPSAQGRQGLDQRHQGASCMQYCVFVHSVVQRTQWTPLGAMQSLERRAVRSGPPRCYRK